MKHWRNGFWISILMSTISITLQASSDLPDASRDGIETVKAWTVQHFQKAELEFSQTNKSRFNSPDYWGNEIVYKIQVDRFNAVTPSQLPELTDDNLDKIPDLRHGGNLKGITERLDYLVDLGVTTILITPVLKHDGSYHGFCTTDFTQIDPTFGSNQDFKDFVKYAHKKGLKVILDIVINHMCDSKTYYSKQASHHNCANDLEAKNWSGQTGGSNFQGDLDFQIRTPFHPGSVAGSGQVGANLFLSLNLTGGARALKMPNAPYQCAG